MVVAKQGDVGKLHRYEARTFSQPSVNLAVVLIAVRMSWCHAVLAMGIGIVLIELGTCRTLPVLVVIPVTAVVGAGTYLMGIPRNKLRHHLEHDEEVAHTWIRRVVVFVHIRSRYFVPVALTEFNFALSEVEWHIHTVGADIGVRRAVRVIDFCHLRSSGHRRVISGRNLQLTGRERQTLTTEIKFLTIQHTTLVLIACHRKMQLIALILHLMELLQS